MDLCFFSLESKKIEFLECSWACVRLLWRSVLQMVRAWMILFIFFRRTTYMANGRHGVFFIGDFYGDIFGASIYCNFYFRDF